MENRVYGDTISNQWELNVMLHQAAIPYKRAYSLQLGIANKRHSQPSLFFPNTHTHTHTHTHTYFLYHLKRILGDTVWLLIASAIIIYYLKLDTLVCSLVLQHVQECVVAVHAYS